MKQFLFLLALIAAAFAAPSHVPGGLLDVNDPAVIANGSRSLDRALGFGGLHGGVHGGAGGSVWTVWDPWALRDALNSHDRRIVYLRGRVDVIALFTGSPGVRLSIGSYTSLIGGDSNAEIAGGGLIVSGVHQVIIQNIKVTNALSFASGEQPNGNGGILSMVPGDFSTIDNIGIDRNSENVWVDHCEFADDPWVAGVGARRHDGLIDITRGASYVTISNSIFRNHNLVSLIGNGVDMGHEDAGRLRVTFFANWFRGTFQRNPYVRFGQVHVLNNLYEDITDYGIGAGIHSQIFIERNVFVNCRTNRGAISSTNVSPRGQIANSVNLFRSCSFDNNLPALTSWNPFNDSYNYRAIPIGDVENHVRRYAGTW